MSIQVDSEYDSGYEAGFSDRAAGRIHQSEFHGEFMDGYILGYQAASRRENAVPMAFALNCGGRVGWYDGNNPGCCGNCKA